MSVRPVHRQGVVSGAGHSQRFDRIGNVRRPENLPPRQLLDAGRAPAGPPQNGGLQRLVVHLDHVELLDVLDLGPLGGVLGLGHLAHDRLGQLLVDLCLGTVGVFQHVGGSGVSVGGDAIHERHAVGVLDSPLVGQALFVSRPKDLDGIRLGVVQNHLNQLFRQFVGVAIVEESLFCQHASNIIFEFGLVVDLAGWIAVVIGHVFYYCHTRNIDRVKHFYSPYNVGKTQFLRCRYNHSRGNVEPLGQRQLNVPGSRRHVQNQVIEGSPLRDAQKLIQELADHGSAHDGRPVVDVAKTHEANTVSLQGSDLAVNKTNNVVVRFDHGRERRPVHVAVKNPNVRSQRLEGVRQVYRGRRFSHATLARTDGDDGSDSGHSGRICFRVGGFLCRHGDVDAVYKGQFRDEPFAIASEGFLDGTGGCR
mmetsp:Transcript_10657/g.25250  ORF Transcript_10657/g.25250 Transcript_10657/m.25250 type:complete len:421 (-) Transcript_10657:489-1751(-)